MSLSIASPQPRVSSVPVTADHCARCNRAIIHPAHTLFLLSVDINTTARSYPTRERPQPRQLVKHRALTRSAQQPRGDPEAHRTTSPPEHRLPSVSRTYRAWESILRTRSGPPKGNSVGSIVATMTVRLPLQMSAVCENYLPLWLRTLRYGTELLQLQRV